MIIWQINQLNHTVESDGSAGFVTTIHWSASKTEDALVAQIYGAEGVDPASPLGLMPYGDVTEPDCTAYLEANNDMVAMEAQLDAQLLNQQQPQDAGGLPWVDNYPQWVVPLAYAVDDVVQYKGATYQVIQAHTSQATWPPDLTPSLWKLYVPAGEDPQPWVQPLGSEDAYQIDDLVTHTGSTWVSTSADNVWEPGVFGWDVV
jgi:hypothetical protein